MGQALAQRPQAMHLVVVLAPGARTMTCMGQASTHLPQAVHLVLSIMYTPLAFWEIAPSVQVRAHLPHMMQLLTLGSRSGAVRLGDNADAAQVRIKGLVKRLGAGTHTAQACLAGILFADNQFFHMRKASYRLK